MWPIMLALSRRSSRPMQDGAQHIRHELEQESIGRQKIIEDKYIYIAYVTDL